MDNLTGLPGYLKTELEAHESTRFVCIYTYTYIYIHIMGMLVETSHI